MVVLVNIIANDKSEHFSSLAGHVGVFRLSVDIVTGSSLTAGLGPAGAPELGPAGSSLLPRPRVLSGLGVGVVERGLQPLLLESVARESAATSILPGRQEAAALLLRAGGAGGGRLH